MNSSAVDSGNGVLDGYKDMGGLTYGVGVLCIGIILVISISFASYLCIHTLHRSHRNGNHLGGAHDLTVLQIEPALVGIDEATLESYPKLTFSEATKLKSKGQDDFCCSICLADYNPTDVLRSLPECGHLFHRKCVDPWLKVNPTCPVCRNSPMPTPLAEVVPLAMASSRSEILI